MINVRTGMILEIIPKRVEAWCWLAYAVRIASSEASRISGRGPADGLNAGHALGCPWVSFLLGCSSAEASVEEGEAPISAVDECLAVRMVIQPAVERTLIQRAHA